MENKTLVSPENQLTYSQTDLTDTQLVHKLTDILSNSSILNSGVIGWKEETNSDRKVYLLDEITNLNEVHKEIISETIEIDDFHSFVLEEITLENLQKIRKIDAKKYINKKHIIELYVLEKEENSNRIYVKYPKKEGSLKRIGRWFWNHKEEIMTGLAVTGAIVTAVVLGSGSETSTDLISEDEGWNNLEGLVELSDIDLENHHNYPEFRKSPIVHLVTVAATGLQYVRGGTPEEKLAFIEENELDL
jgi:hypothetical protein